MLWQELRDQDKQQDVLKAKVDTLEGLLQESGVREQKVEGMRQEVQKLMSAKDKVRRSPETRP